MLEVVNCSGATAPNPVKLLALGFSDCPGVVMPRRSLLEECCVLPAAGVLAKAENLDSSAGGRGRKSLQMAFLGVLAVLFLSACGEPGPTPIGAPNSTIVTLAANGWISADTIYQIDPMTGEERMEAYLSDMRPDTLANGAILYKVAEHMPIFEGCELDEDPSICTQRKLAEYVQTNMHYPRAAQVAGLEGNAVATFIIGPDGRVGETGVERSLGDALDSEVLRLVAGMPAWHPAFQGGRPVSIRYRLPVSFKLPEN